MTPDQIMSFGKNYGIVALAAVVYVLFLIRVYRDKESLRKEMNTALDKKDLQLAEQAKVHRAELQTLMERYITKTETMFEKNNELAGTVTEALTLLERRWGRD
jgi:hypothetical protein